MKGTVEAVCLSEQKGPKSVAESITLRQGHGVEGDVHAGDWHRQVSLLSLDRIEDMRRSIPDLALGAFGENIVCRNFSPEKLTVGSHVRAGDAILEITQLGKECHTRCQIFHTVGDCIMPKFGTFARVIRSGTLRSGDTLCVEPRIETPTVEVSPKDLAADSLDGFPPLIHIVGRKNHGKTTLILELITALTKKGLRVGTIKHTEHTHELDTPGKDSHAQRLHGASPVAMVSGELTAIYLPNLDPNDPYQRLASLFSDCDLVLVEGHLEGPGPKIEVWRQTVGTDPIAASRQDIVAVVSDESPQVPTLVWPRDDLANLISNLESAGLLGRMSNQQRLSQQ